MVKATEVRLKEPDIQNAFLLTHDATEALTSASFCDLMWSLQESSNSCITNCENGTTLRID